MKKSAATPSKPAPPIPAAEALSFLKQTKGVLSWTASDLAKALKVGLKEAEQVLAVLEIQGYVKPAPGPKAEWLTTPAGEAVSGSKTPRFSRESVEQALAALAERIRALNHDAAAQYKVADAVAFGDFLGGFSADLARVQAADIGIQLMPRNSDGHEANSFTEQARRLAVLRQLRSKTLLTLRFYERWMSHRSHRRLL